MTAASSTPQWFVVHCKPREDSRALQHLERQAFTCYQPMFRAEKFRNGRRIYVQEPLFPRYIFVQVDAEEKPWYSIRSTRGVSDIVRFGDKPAAVHVGIVENIRTRLADPTAMRPQLKPGERVQIMEGAFSQLEAIFLSHDGDERVVLLLNIMQSDQALHFPLGSIRKLA